MQEASWARKKATRRSWEHSHVEGGFGDRKWKGTEEEHIMAWRWAWKEERKQRR